MGYSTGPYSHITSLPVPARPEIHSARNINLATSRYTTDSTTGGFERMPQTTQRVVILTTRAMQETTVKFNTIENRNQLRLELSASLAILTAKPAPRITLFKILVLSEVAGSARVEIQFKDLTTDEDQTVQLT